MTMKKYKPSTPSLRQMAQVKRENDQSGRRPLKSLVKGISKSLGRNNEGVITSRYRGGGSKKKYRMIDFKRLPNNLNGKVVCIEYDPNRTSHIALINYSNGTKSYIISPNNLKIGDVIVSSQSADIRPGNAKPLKDIPVGTVIHNVEIYPGAGGKVGRSAGSFVQLMAKESDYVLLRLPSGELKKAKPNCMATIGQVGNLDHEQENWGKAGKSRLRGIRPRVRGVAMNPIDHPHGGGEGRTSGGRHPVTPWGKGTKGLKTRHNLRTDSLIVKRRR
jgi:large subunit ribosomal protein L2